ncbi:GNAT family N-acetyltransferase [Vibrio sp. SM6]|uniref:GNAT family N-acetyltransferase n=1 Tax=Vibrio agarilyticus TaxID=2726741 RepID=A0A7X8TN29_9VIBR|nr:GNAT family N-acetyltransferase [Vibrio agarilyticus]NLS11536.1 GNAT family N-acetyltransferase [Vibrio agarilyticus]
MSNKTFMISNEITILPAALGEAQLVGELVFAMETELWGNDASKLDKATFIDTATHLIDENNGFWAFIARDEKQRPLGVVTLVETRAIYASGTLGQIMELYIVPTHRSTGVGAKLIQFCRQFGVDRGWGILEVGAPAQPQWLRTKAFYQAQGFNEIGPKLEMAL